MLDSDNRLPHSWRLDETYLGDDYLSDRLGESRTPSAAMRYYGYLTDDLTDAWDQRDRAESLQANRQ